MRYILFFVACLLSVRGSFAQSDTTYIYYAEDGSATSKNKASTYLKIYPENNAWYGKKYFAKLNQLIAEGAYSAPNDSSQTGSFKYYNEKGVLNCTEMYSGGKPTDKTFYYSDGKKRSWLSYANGKVAEQKG